MKQLFYHCLAPLHQKHALKQLRHLENRLVSQRARFALPFVYRSKGMFRSIRPRQNPSEIEALYDRICELNPKRVLEIGTAKGGSLYLWTQAATDDALIVSADLPGGEFGGGYPTPRLALYQAFAKPNQTLHLLRIDSHKPESLTQVTDLFGGPTVDFAFIDGDHRYEGVRQDFLEYSQLVRPGGLIAFHDILPQPDSPETQVCRLWEEIRDHFQTWEFVDRDERQYVTIGIGLLQVPEQGIDPNMLSSDR